MTRRLIWFVCACLLATGPTFGCTTESGEEGDQWRVDSGADGGSDTVDDSTSSDDAGERDSDEPDSAVEDGTTDDGGQDVPNPDDAGVEDPVFEEASLEGTNWYGVFRVAEGDGITGTVFELSLMADNQVEIGAFGSVTGSWEVFDERRLRLYELVRDGEPNQPEQFVFDVDVDSEQRVQGFELFIPQGPSGEPYTLRLEQLGDPAYSLDNLDGDWQSEETFTDQNGNDMRLAIRFFSNRIGYGVYNGAYIEFLSGDAEVLSLDDGTSYWLSLPPDDGEPQAAFAGEIQTGDDGSVTIYSPRQTNPGEQPAEFESEPLESVSSFSL